MIRRCRHDEHARSRGIEKGKGQECRRYGQREKKVVRGVARYRGRRLNIRQLLLGDGQTARRLECFRLLGGDATVESTGKSCWKI